MTLVENIGRHFDSRAAGYDNPLTAFIGERELRVIRGFIPAGAPVLDYGCGTGRAALDHLRRGCRVTAYDVSREMLAIAEAKARRMGLTAEFSADLGQLAGRHWPVVTCIGVLDYYSDPVPLLTALRGYLSRSSRLIVTFPNALSPLGWLYAAVSRFTFPAIPRTPHFVRRAAARARLHVISLGYAFPSIAPIGHTLAVALSRSV